MPSYIRAVEVKVEPGKQSRYFVLAAIDCLRSIQETPKGDDGSVSLLRKLPPEAVDVFSPLGNLVLWDTSEKSVVWVNGFLGTVNGLRVDPRSFSKAGYLSFKRHIQIKL